MKLSSLTKPTTAKDLNKITETRFGFAIDYDKITLPKANAMRNKIFEAVTAIRKSSGVHTAERNPKYVEMLVVYEGLSRWIDAYKSQRLTEGEIGQAQAILAAKDMVDSIQDMIEKVGKMQNEQLPALVDSIRDQLDSMKADNFKNSVGQMLGTLVQQLNQARDQIDAEQRSLAGEEAAPQDPAGMVEPTVGDEMQPEPEETDGFEGTPPSVGGTDQVGRGLR